jgi:protease-4
VQKALYKMSISNLHSLFNKPWYIEESYAQAHLPLLFNLLAGKEVAASKDDILGIVAADGSATTANATGSVAILSIKTPILKYDQFCGPQGTKTMMRSLDRLKNDASIAGVILDIDSGGGQVYGTPEFHDYIASYPKPVVTYTDGYLCSAAYYIAAASSHIIANKRADSIGSIGAYSQILDLAGYYKKQGATLHTIYATKSTKKNEGYRKVLEGDYKTYIKEELDPLVETFINDMKQSCAGLNEEVFTGATYNAEKSLELGLINQIGTLQDAINKVLELSQTNKSSKTTQKMDKNFPKVQTALGMENNFESNDQGVYLSEEQLQILETTLENHETTLADTQTAHAVALTAATDPLNAQITALTEGSNELTTAIDAALVSADIPREQLTDAAAITALSALLTEYGKKDGASHTKLKDNADESDLGKTNIVGGIDISKAMNN